MAGYLHVLACLLVSTVLSGTSTFVKAHDSMLILSAVEWSLRPGQEGYISVMLHTSSRYRATAHLAEINCTSTSTRETEIIDGRNHRVEQTTFWQHRNFLITTVTYPVSPEDVHGVKVYSDIAQGSVLHFEYLMHFQGNTTGLVQRPIVPELVYTHPFNGIVNTMLGHNHTFVYTFYSSSALNMTSGPYQYCWSSCGEFNYSLTSSYERSRGLTHYQLEMDGDLSIPPTQFEMTVSGRAEYDPPDRQIAYYRLVVWATLLPREDMSSMFQGKLKVDMMECGKPLEFIRSWQVGSTACLICSVYTYGETNVRLSKDGTHLRETNTGSRSLAIQRLDQEHSYLVYRIDNVEQRDAGVYSCRGESPANALYDEYEASITVV